MTEFRRLPAATALAGALLLTLGCGDSTGETIEPGDLVGTWWVVTSGVTLTFAGGSEGQVYTLRDPQRVYSQLLEEGSDLLVQGYWSLAGSSLYLEDESGPVACPAVADRFVITMNAARTIMTLTYLGDECQLRALVLADHTWQRRADAS